MKKNLLPRMQKVKLTDTDGKEFLMQIELRKGVDHIYVFLADTHQAGASRLAKDALHYIEKIIQRLHLNPARTVFFRHIYQDFTGSNFGRFHVDWTSPGGPQYRFQMLSNVDDLQSIRRIIDDTAHVSLQEHVATRKSA